MTVSLVDDGIKSTSTWCTNEANKLLESLGSFLGSSQNNCSIFMLGMYEKLIAEMKSTLEERKKPHL